MASETPKEVHQRGFEREVRLHYTTKSEVQELLKPLSDTLQTHLGHHEGSKVTLAMVIPLLCVLVSAAAILVAALVR